MSLTIDHDTPQVMEITGLSTAVRAQGVIAPNADPCGCPHIRVTPMVISVLDYYKGFAHTDLVTC